MMKKSDLETIFSLWRRKIRVKRKRASSVTKHYLNHKKQARELTLTRLNHFNQYYQLTWNRVAIRNQKRCWGSCSSKKNLNFNYKILFLPSHLQDYIVVHEMCHLKHLNHGQEFWRLVAEQLPNYDSHRAELRMIEKSLKLTNSTLIKKGNTVENNASLDDVLC
jgi:predicted metal-dependent hydrolase